MLQAEQDIKQVVRELDGASRTGFTAATSEETVNDEMDYFEEARTEAVRHAVCRWKQVLGSQHPNVNPIHTAVSTLTRLERTSNL